MASVILNPALALGDVLCKPYPDWFVTTVVDTQR